MSRALEVVTRELKPDLLQDYLQFFDKDAFSDFPNWSGCYCGFYDTPGEGKDWNPTAKAGPAHRAARAERISSGRSHGVLAYAEDKVVGWCNAQARASFTNMRRYSVAIDNLDERVGSVMCFLVSPSYRGKGVCSLLLNAACDMFRREKIEVAEGYPTVTNPVRGSSDIPWAEENYKGPLNMYLKAGFTVHRQLERFAIVRKNL